MLIMSACSVFGISIGRVLALASRISCVGAIDNKDKNTALLDSSSIFVRPPYQRWQDSFLQPSSCSRFCSASPSLPLPLRPWSRVLGVDRYVKHRCDVHERVPCSGSSGRTHGPSPRWLYSVLSCPKPT
ncbi:hypothetical protein BD779DRAFT_1564808 [Infundibulicybe gibba]|nr:hypothetical protein BD779DRAFT_1564808 [Infundibulicybe gibba]